MSFVELTPAEVDAKSPIDDALLTKIKDNFTDLNSRIIAAKSFPYDFRINGPLSFINPSYGKRKRLDGALISNIQTLTFAKLYCEVPGTLGTLSVDLRKYKKTNTPITSITRTYSGAISSIARIAPALATQSITRATPQIATQSIAKYKTTLAITSIVLLPNNQVKYNLSSAPDADWTPASSVIITSATAGANNGTFFINRVNDDGGANIVITNASGVAQTGAAGNMDSELWTFNFVNPVNAQFVAGEIASMASHTNGNNNGTFNIYGINLGGNNIVVRNSIGVAQAGVAGTTDCLRFSYNYAAPVPSDFAVGEFPDFAGHTTAGNNIPFGPIAAVNFGGGNNIIVFNINGATQGGVAGTASTYRYIYALPTDPSGQIAAGESVVISGTTSGSNSGVFIVGQVNRSALNNIVFYNGNGVAQVGAAGTLYSQYMLYNFSSDQSAVYSTTSNIEIADTVTNSANLGFFDVLEVNRGGGSNYNVKVINTSGVEQVNPSGRILSESKTVLTSPLNLTFGVSDLNVKNNSYLQVVSTSSMTSEAVFNSADIAALAVLAVDIISIPSGNISDIVIQTA